MVVLSPYADTTATRTGDLVYRSFAQLNDGRLGKLFMLNLISVRRRPYQVFRVNLYTTWVRIRGVIPRGEWHSLCTRPPDAYAASLAGTISTRRNLLTSDASVRFISSSTHSALPPVPGLPPRLTTPSRIPSSPSTSCFVERRRSRAFHWRYQT